MRCTVYHMSVLEHPVEWIFDNGLLILAMDDEKLRQSLAARLGQRPARHDFSGRIHERQATAVVGYEHAIGHTRQSGAELFPLRDSFGLLSTRALLRASSQIAGDAERAGENIIHHDETNFRESRGPRRAWCCEPTPLGCPKYRQT